MKFRNLLFIAVCLILSLLLCSCGEKPVANENYDNATQITFSENSASAKGFGASVLGADVRITAQGTYVLSGSTSDGSIIIDASKAEITLILKELDLTNTEGPAIYIKNAKKVTFTLADGTNNVLTDGNFYEIVDITSKVDGAIFAKSNIVFNGDGTLTVNGNNAHGIVSKDGLKIESGKINVNSKSAAICGKDYIEIANANININAGTDGLRSDNITDVTKGYITVQSGTLNITSGNDAIQAHKKVTIEGGTFNIKTTSTDPLGSSKGIKSTKGIEILGGSFTINSIDDSVHSDMNVLIAGGDFSISSGDDGIHANNELSITGGNINIKNSYEGIEATSIKIGGGNIVINATDDGMNSAGGNDQSAGGDSFVEGNGGIEITDGYIVIHSGADGIDVVGPFSMSGGVLFVDGPSKEKSGALDFGSDSLITGGIVVALGFSETPETFERASQGISLIQNNGEYVAGDVISVCDKNGNVLFAFASEKTFNGMLLSAVEFQPGNSVTIYKNANVSGLDENGFAYNTTQTGGQIVTTITFQ